MNWKSMRDNKYRATLDVSAIPADKVCYFGTALFLNDSISEDTVLDIADGVIDVLPDFCATSGVCEIRFKKYVKEQMTVTLTEENWSQEDWDYFRYDLAMALAAVVRNDKLRIYKNKVARNQALSSVIAMEDYILKESGNPNAHLVAKTGYQTVRTPEVLKPVPAADNFMNLPE